MSCDFWGEHPNFQPYGEDTCLDVWFKWHWFQNPSPSPSEEALISSDWRCSKCSIWGPYGTGLITVLSWMKNRPQWWAAAPAVHFCINYCPQESDYAVLRRVGVLISALTPHLALRWKHKEAAPVIPSDQWLTTESRRLVWRAAADCRARHRNPTQTWHQCQPEPSPSTSVGLFADFIKRWRELLEFCNF